MGFTISETNLRRVEAAQQVLLRPDQYSTVAEWLASGVDAITHLMQANAVHAFVPQGGAPIQAGARVGSSFFQGVDAFFAYAPDGDARERDAMKLHMEMQQTRVARGAGVYHETHLADRRTIEASPFYQEVCAPHGIQYTTGLSVPWRDSEAAICVSFARDDAPGYDLDASVLLRLLVPAFESGLLYWSRLVSAASRMRETIDALPHAAALFDADGAELHRNRALRHLLDAEHDPDRVVEAIKSVAGDVRPGPRSVSHEAAPRRVVDGAKESYRLRACVLQSGTAGAPSVLVMVDRLSLFPPQQVVEDRLGLTARQAEVAGLVARGASNADIADRLHISPHTARHHVARILKKLNISSRSSIAPTLLQVQSLTPGQ